MWENASTSTMFVGASKDEILFPKSFLVLTFLSPETPEMLVFFEVRFSVAERASLLSSANNVVAVPNFQIARTHIVRFSD